MLLKCLTQCISVPKGNYLHGWCSSVSHLGRDSSPSALLKEMFTETTFSIGNYFEISSVLLRWSDWMPALGDRPLDWIQTYGWCISVEDLTREWKNEHDDLPSAPICIIPEYFPCHKESCPEYCSAGKNVCEMFASRIPETNSYKHNETYVKHPTGCGMSVHIKLTWYFQT